MKMFSNRKVRLLLVIAFLLGGLWAIARSYQLVLFAYTPFNEGSSQEFQLEVRSGDPPIKVAKSLERNGITGNSAMLLKVGKYLRKWKEMKAGEYLFTPSMTPMEIFSTLESGVSVAHKVTFAEGLNIYQIAEILEKDGLGKKTTFIRLCKNPKFIASQNLGTPPPPSLEGYLYPETYFFNHSMTPESILETMVSHFKAVWDQEFKGQAQAIGMTRHEVITLASVIEKETGAPFERDIISSVYHNRLEKKMRLGSDPTTIYGIWETFDGNLKRSHLKEKNDYNTYAKRGLPIGAIANPGKAAIAAALHPKETPYLYFVSKNDGTHHFSETVKEHNQAVKQYQMNPEARRGKSWRDLQKDHPSKDH